MKCPKVCSLNFLLVYNNKKQKEVKNHPDIFEYFKHYSRDLEAHGSRHLAVCIGEHISETQIEIQVRYFFGQTVLFYTNPSRCAHANYFVVRNSYIVFGFCDMKGLLGSTIYINMIF